MFSHLEHSGWVCNPQTLYAFSKDFSFEKPSELDEFCLDIIRIVHDEGIQVTATEQKRTGMVQVCITGELGQNVSEVSRLVGIIESTYQRYVCEPAKKQLSRWPWPTTD